MTDDTAPWLDDEPSQSDFTPFQSALKQRARLAQTVEYLEGELKQAAADLRAIDEKVLPELMDQLQVSQLVLEDGTRLKLDQVITASLTKPETRARALKWLRAQGLADLITRDVTVRFGKGEDAQAETLVAELGADGYAYTDEENVNTASFKAVIRELLDQGAALPSDDIGVFVVRKAVVKNSTL